MTKGELIKKMAYLESLNDHLVTEIHDADRLMRLVGFTDGLATVKATAAAMRDGEMDDFEFEGFDEEA